MTKRSDPIYYTRAGGWQEEDPHTAECRECSCRLGEYADQGKRLVLESVGAWLDESPATRSISYVEIA